MWFKMSVKNGHSILYATIKGCYVLHVFVWFLFVSPVLSVQAVAPHICEHLTDLASSLFKLTSFCIQCRLVLYAYPVFVSSTCSIGFAPPHSLLW